MGFGLALKSLSLFLRAIQFGSVSLVFAIFIYFLATLHNHDLPIATYIRAVTGISGAGILYTAFALLLVCCLGGVTFFSFLGMLLDVAFAGAFIYVAWATRGGASSCKGNVNTPFGSGNTNVDNTVPTGQNGFTKLPSLHAACKLETATFAIAIVAVIFFLLSIPIELALARHRKKERAFGPSPNNGYTAGTPKRRFWQRKPKQASAYQKNPDALPTHATPADVRTSYATDTTAVGATTTDDAVLNKYGHTTPVAGHGTAVPYGHTAAGANNGWQTTTTTHAPHQGYVSNTNGTF